MTEFKYRGCDALPDRTRHVFLLGRHEFEVWVAPEELSVMVDGEEWHV